jgi:membrane-bound serine protease (ClpP class)
MPRSLDTAKRPRGIAAILVLALILFVGAGRDLRAVTPGETTETAAARPTVCLVRLTGTVNPGMAELLRRALAEAQQGGAVCLIAQLDTPGGLVSTLRDMVRDIMASPVPVVVYVAPSGARAASAGALLTIAANVAAMAPGTNIGAAHPVDLGKGSGEDETMAKKAENDVAAMARAVATERGRNAVWAEDAVRESVSASATEALELNVIDILARDLDSLLTQLDGIEVVMQGKKTRLALEDPLLLEVKESLREKVLQTIADPNIAYILMMIGVTGLYFELAHPGTILPGTAGAICLLLGLFALQTLPVSATGLLLLLLAVILFVLELFVSSNGILGLSGLVALLLGSLMLFNTPRTGVSIAAEVLWTTFISVGSFLGAVVYLATRASLSKPLSGMEGLIGERGSVTEAVGPKGGRVFLHGELWTAISEEDIPTGVEIRVVGFEGMKLRVSQDQGGNP